MQGLGMCECVFKDGEKSRKERRISRKEDQIAEFISSGI